MTTATLGYKPKFKPVDWAHWMKMIGHELKKLERKRGQLPYEDAPEPYGLTAGDIIRTNFPKPVTETDHNSILDGSASTITSK